MEVLADISGFEAWFEVVRSEMRSSTALGRALLAASAIGIFAGIFTTREAQGADANALQAHTHDAGRASQTSELMVDGGLTSRASRWPGGARCCW